MNALTKQQRKALKADFETIERQTLFTIAAMTGIKKGVFLGTPQETAEERIVGCTDVLVAMASIRKTLNIPLPAPCNTEQQ